MNGALGGGEEKKLPGAGSDPSNSGGIPMNLVAFQTPYGKMGLAEENGALVHLYLPNEGMPRIAEHETALLADGKGQLMEYFAGKRTVFKLPLAPDILTIKM